MVTDAVLVALPGTMCTPAVFGPLARTLAGQVTVDPVSWLTEPGPWDIPSIAERVADHVSRRWHRPVVVHGRYDRARPPEQGRELAASLPDAEFRLVKAAGHTPVYERPEVVAAAGRDLLARV